jgi:toxin ParE1/3/4
VKILWAGPAVEDLECIRRYIQPEDARAATRVALTIVSSVAQLAATPAIGRPGRVAGTRELVLVRAPYIVAYRVTAGVVEVLRVLHTSRRWPRRLAGSRR